MIASTRVVIAQPVVGLMGASSYRYDCWTVRL